MRRLLERVLAAFVTLALGAALGVFLLEYAAGCGETYIDAHGVRHAHECVFFHR